MFTTIILQIAFALLISYSTTKLLHKIKLSHKRQFSNHVISSHDNEFEIPPNFTAPFGKYPNILGITSEMRQQFHPVVDLKDKDVLELDLSKTFGASQLIKPEDADDYIQSYKERLDSDKGQYTIGKYDENRVNLYSSEMFENENNAIDGYEGKRTLHIGIDLGAPVGEAVHSFWNGKVHSVGYNSHLGDYGYVIVVEYDLKEMRSADGPDGIDKFWVLYGHLDSSTIERHDVGENVVRGAILGNIGNVKENGGWTFPHCHFQVSTIEPSTHDMPGAVKIEDRSRSLLQYPDPRYIVGDLF